MVPPLSGFGGGPRALPGCPQSHRGGVITSEDYKTSMPTFPIHFHKHSDYGGCLKKDRTTPKGWDAGALWPMYYQNEICYILSTPLVRCSYTNAHYSLKNNSLI